MITSFRFLWEKLKNDAGMICLAVLVAAMLYALFVHDIAANFYPYPPNRVEIKVYFTEIESDNNWIELRDYASSEKCWQLINNAEKSGGWSNTIVNNSRRWTVINVDNPEKIAFDLNTSNMIDFACGGGKGVVEISCDGVTDRYDLLDAEQDTILRITRRYNMEMVASYIKITIQVFCLMLTFFLVYVALRLIIGNRLGSMKCLNGISAKSMVYIFVFVVLVSSAAFWIDLVTNPDSQQLKIFVSYSTNFFGDYQVSLFLNRRPYEIESSIYSYLPISYFVYMPFAYISEFCRIHELPGTIPIMSMVLFSVFSVLLYSHALYKVCNKYRNSALFIVGILFSGVMIRTIERGNLIVLTAAMICYFMAYYDGNTIYDDIRAVFALAFAASLKIFPVIFAAMWIKKRKYKTLLVAAVVTAFFVFAPFIFLDGGFVTNFRGFMRNAHWQAIDYGSSSAVGEKLNLNNIIYMLLNQNLGFTQDKAILWGDVVQNVLRVLGILMAIIALFVKDDFITAFLLFGATAYLSVNAQMYVFLYLPPVLVMGYSSLRERPWWMNLLFLLYSMVVFTTYQYWVELGNVTVSSYQVSSIIIFPLFMISLIYGLHYVMMDKSFLMGKV